MKWVSDSVELKRAKLIGNRLDLHFEQDDSVVDAKDFDISGEVLAYPGFCNQRGGIFIEFGIRDCFGRLARFRLRDNGYSSPGLQFPAGNSFKTVSLISFDGLRLRVIYGSDRRTATIYTHSPSEAIYKVGRMVSYGGPLPRVGIPTRSSAFLVETKLMRGLEKSMLPHGGTYDAGRLGAEICYMICRIRLGLTGLVIEEPSSGGKDLFTHRGDVIIQTRLLTQARLATLSTGLQVEIPKLVSKLHEDLAYNPRMKRGIAVFSYDTPKGTVRSILIEISF
jgi:hypothetical protein